MRARGLFGDLAGRRRRPPISPASLIGHELVAALPRRERHRLSARRAALVRLYTEALKCYGVDTSILDADAVVRGLFKLAQMLPRR